MGDAFDGPGLRVQLQNQFYVDGVGRVFDSEGVLDLIDAQRLQPA